MNKLIPFTFLLLFLGFVAIFAAVYSVKSYKEKDKKASFWFFVFSAISIIAFNVIFFLFKDIAFIDQ